MKLWKKRFVGIACFLFAFFVFTNFHEVCAASKKSVEEKITKEIFSKKPKKSIDISSYDLKKADAKKAIENVLKENNCESLVTYSLKTGTDQKVDKIDITMDSALESVVTEVNEISENDNNNSMNEEELAKKRQKTIADYAKLQKYYEANPDYFGVPIQFFYKKDTKETPLGAVAALAGIDYDKVDLGLDQLDETIVGMQQGLQGFVQYYGKEFLQQADKILAKVNDKNMSEVEKYMVLNDELANLITFDDAFFQGKQEFISSTAFGALVEKKAVCIGYCSAYAYIVQRMHPEIYKHKDGTWKTKEEVGDNAIVDYACRTHDHYINAIKIDGKWYYVDPSFADIKVEENQRVRAETEGNLGHMFFLFTQKSFENWSGFSGTDLDTAYADKCTDDTYENAWFSQVDSNIPYDSTYWYYVKPQVNTKVLLDGGVYHDKRDQLTCRNRKTGKIQTLVDYETGKVYTPDGKEVATNQDIAKEYKIDVTYNKTYPGVQHSVGLYAGNLYFNLGNKIYEYQPKSGKIVLIKEYNEVAVKQTNDANVSQSFYITSNSKESIMKLQERPVAGLSIKDDGKMYVALATNFSSKTEYKTECVAYKPAYGNFGEDNGLSKKFEKCANVKETLDMKHLAGTKHTYKKVTVAPTCLREGFEEERCTVCGRIKAGTRKRTKNPLTHEYEHVQEPAENEDEGEGIDTNVCKICKKTDEDGLTYAAPVFEWSEDAKTCTAVFKEKYDRPEQRIECTITSKNQKASCTKPEATIYTASADFDDKTYIGTKTVVTRKALGHDYDKKDICKRCGAKKPSSTVTLKAKKDVYTGKAIAIDPAQVKGSTGKVTYKYYVDSKCKKATSKANAGAAGAPVNPGVYYVKASVAADKNYKAATSKAVKLTIVPKTPVIVSVSNNGKNLSVTWKKVSKASGYYVYRSTDGKKFTKVATIKKNTVLKYNDTKANKNGQKYVYKVSAYYYGTATVTSAGSEVKTAYFSNKK